MSPQRTPHWDEPPESYIVAYDPQQKTVIEIWSRDETMFADLPSGELVQGENACHVLQTVMETDRIQVRDINPGGA